MELRDGEKIHEPHHQSGVDGAQGSFLNQIDQQDLDVIEHAFNGELEVQQHESKHEDDSEPGQIHRVDENLFFLDDDRTFVDVLIGEMLALNFDLTGVQIEGHKFGKFFARVMEEAVRQILTSNPKLGLNRILALGLECNIDVVIAVERRNADIILGSHVDILVVGLHIDLPGSEEDADDGDCDKNFANNLKQLLTILGFFRLRRVAVIRTVDVVEIHQSSPS